MMHGGNVELLGCFVKKERRILERLEVCAVSAQVVNLKSLACSGLWLKLGRGQIQKSLSL
jgi:hypothetical protein